MRKKIFLSILICLFAAGSVHAQGYGVGTPMEAKNMVMQAVAYIKVNGEEKALQEFDKPYGKFQWRDLYVFAYDLKGVMKGHPNPKLIGRNLYDEPDSKGKLFRKDIVDLVNSRGSGWVDYTYMNPMTRQEEANPRRSCLEDPFQLRVLPGHHQHRRLFADGRLGLDREAARTGNQY